MRRLLPPWALLLLAAIIVVGVMVWLRANPVEPEKEDPLADAAAALVRALGLEVDPGGVPGGGVLVTGVESGGGAEMVGLTAGDRIVACGSQSVWHAHQLVELMQESMQYGRPGILLVEKEGEYRQVVFGRAGMMPMPPPQEGGGAQEGGGPREVGARQEGGE